MENSQQIGNPLIGKDDKEKGIKETGELEVSLKMCPLKIVLIFDLAGSPQCLLLCHYEQRNSPSFTKCKSALKCW